MSNLSPGPLSTSGRRALAATMLGTVTRLGAVAFVEPVGGRRGWPSKLSGCVDPEPPVQTSIGRRSPGSGSRRR
jgi:hypothetical protein